ncbi:MAG: class I SAM-dependent methyltransferase [Planctomycetota bacterium]|nr:class I SAM-dependent methyltransferase [Planctomycetota bacterium]
MPKTKKRHTTAEKSDRYVLYQKTVQAPGFEVEFCDKAYRYEFGSRALLYREDFCGTANLACEWVKSYAKRRVIGVDLDPEPLEWGRKNNLTKLSKSQLKRVQLFEANVLDLNSEKVDVLGAQNFSYFVFHERAVLLKYFKVVYGNLKDKGIFVLDVMGGPESQLVAEDDPRQCDGYTYIWEHFSFNPINSLATCKIHFVFEDGSKMKDAFVYPWRLWTVPELRDLLDEAGFSRTDVYWEGTNEKTGGGDGNYTLTTVADADAAWVAYLVAVKK